jgi:polysaccharide biosynthesis transport protein
MTIYNFIKILLRNIKLVVAIPFLAGIIMYLLTLNQSLKYTSELTIFTDVTSSNSIENMGTNKVDFFAAQNAYNNLLSIIGSRSVLEETSLRLFTMHLMLNSSKKGIISKRSFSDLQKIVPDEVKQLVVIDNYEESLLNISNYIEQDKNNFLYGLINFDHPHYSMKAISDMQVKRLSSSDIMQISYQADDPGICFQTLEILVDVFFEKYSNMKRNQTSAAVEYFELQLEEVTNKLRNTEKRLLEFNTRNEIINYYEQTKHISSQQEKIEIKLQDIQLEYEAANAVLKKLELEINSRYKINFRNAEILNIREDLIKTSSGLAKAEIMKENSDDDEKARLILQKEKLELVLKNKIDSLYFYERNSQGIEIKKLLDDWLLTVVQYESADARLAAMKEKKDEFMQLYRQYAPLGAKLKRIEREISVNEEEYLDVLHHLGQARLKQQNAELMANIKVLDKANLPIDPMPTKRKMFIIIVSIFSLLFTLLALFVIEFLDKRIRNITRLSEYSGMPVAGAFLQDQEISASSNEVLSKRSVKLMIESILITIPSSGRNHPVIIQMLSHWDNEGKSYISEKIINQLEASGQKCLSIGFSPDTDDQKSFNHIAINSNILFSAQNYATYLSRHHKEDYETADYIFIEVPAVSGELYNPALLKSSDINYLIVEASRTWSPADDFYAKKLKRLLGEKIASVLNKTKPDDMEDIMGEIPKKRTRLRRYVKNVILKRFI